MGFPQLAALLVSLLVAVYANVRTIEQPFLSAEPSTPGSMGTKFLVGFMQNISPRPAGNTEPDAYLLVTTNETGVVEFDVTTMFGGVQSSNSYTVDSSAPTRVNFPADDVYVTGIQQRDKAIWVQTSNNKKIAVKVVNDEFRSTDGFVALPCDGMTVPSDFRTYEYLVLSTNQDTTNQPGSTTRSSQFLVITCDADTEVEVEPSTAISGSGAFAHTRFGPGETQASSNWRVNTINNLVPAKQTLLISITNEDLTGTVIKGNKPLVVISGHQCGQVTERVTACDHNAAQIPPHTTWGYTFLLNPLSGRQSGDLYRFATLQDNTDVTITCVDAGSSTSTVEYAATLNSSQGSNWGQFATHSVSCGPSHVEQYCCLESSNPVVLAQYSYGYTRDGSCNGGELGDPFMSVIPPIVQYLRLYHLVPVNISSGSLVTHFFSVSVAVRYFQTDRIMLDNAPLELDTTQWQAIYCSTGEICGYGITKDFDNQYHSLFHADANAAIFVHTYGFSIQNSYAIAGGMELQPISGTMVSCEVPDDCVVEGSSVTVTCTRSLDLSEQSRIQVNTADGSATAPADYTTLNIPENRPNFFADNVLNYRGGDGQDSVIPFDVQVASDSIDEPLEIFYIDVTSVRTAIVVTPRVTVTICGVGGCDMLDNPENGVVETTGFAPSDTATYTCNSGYELVGTRVRTCGTDEEWSDVPPTCRPVCPTLGNPANGMVSLTGTSIGDTATYTCNEGHEFVGAPVLNCQSNGMWDNSPPVCQPLCPDLGNPDNGMVTQFGNSARDNATYVCDEGYELVGAPVLNCQDDGTWDNPPPTCTPLCPDQSNPANGVVSQSGNSEGDTATYTCNDGYELVGSETLNCQSDGNWDDVPPVCRPLCPDLANPANGVVTLSGNSAGDTATYMCNSRFELVGVPVLNCLDDGTWDNPPPECQSIEVMVSFDPASYTVTEGEDGAVELILVRSGDLSRATVVTVTTADGSAIAGSDYTATTMTVTFIAGGTEARVSVQITDDNMVENVEEFTATLSSSESNVMIVEDRATVRVQDNDVLVSFDPTSLTVTEGEDGAVELILVRSGDLSRATVVTVTTADGSAIAGSDYTATTMTVTFIAGGTEARVGVQVSNDLLIESSETFVGLLTSSEQNVMIGDGTATVTILDIDECPSLPDIPNGSVAVSGFGTGDTAVYSCGEGFGLDGDSTRECLFDSSWSGEAPACRSLAVLVFFDPLSYTVTEGEDEFVILRLNRSGDTDLTTNLTFMTLPGTADESDFTPVMGDVVFEAGVTSVAVNVMITNDITLEDDEIFTATIISKEPNVIVDDTRSNADITILEDDDVSIGFNPTAYMVLEGGSVELIIERMGDAEVAVVATVSTRDGSAKAGEDYVRLDGVSVTFLPGVFTQRVSLNTLADLPAEGDEDLFATLSAVDARVDVTQREATIIITEDVVRSISFSPENVVVGEGNGSAQVCLDLSVPLSADLQVVVSASAGTADSGSDFLAGTQTASFTAGSTRTCVNFVIIDDDLALEGDETFTATFETPDSFVSADPTTATVTILDNDVFTVQFTEDDYSYVEGDPNARVCLEGNGEIAQPATATVSSLAQGTATVGEDYVALSSYQVEFTPNGESTVCISVTVTDDPVLEEDESFPLTIDSVSPTPGVVTGPQSSTTFFIRDNDAVSVRFNPTQYTVVEGGSVQLTIERIGDAQEPFVVLVTTTDGTATAGEGDYTPLIEVEVTFNQGESTKTVTLNTLDDVLAEGPEYLEATLAVVDPRVTVSTPNATVVITEDAVCPTLGNPANGMVSLTGTSIGDTATYTCNEGHEFVGAPVLNCQSNGMWDNSPPVCKPLCPDLGNPDNGMVTQFGNSAGDNATYVCDEGYELVGAPVLNCQDDGMWDNPPPTCTPLCPDQSNPSNGVVSQSGNSEGDTATYTCNDGYELVGSETLNCQSDGNWDDVPPVCRPFCPDLANPADGVVTLSGNSAGDTATYMCNSRFELVGVPVLNCLDDGTWDNPPPECQSIEVMVSFDPTSYTVTEGEDGTAELRLVRSGDTAGETVVTITLGPGTAIAGNDYTSTPITVVFGPGATEATAQVPIVDDSIVEETEEFRATLSTTDQIVVLGNRFAGITILDNDVPEPEFDQTMYTVPENNRTVPLCIDIGVELPGPMEFTITSKSKDPPEAQEADFSPSTTITVTPPSSMACIDFTGLVVDDDIALEGVQSFNICVGNSTAMVVIIDDDIPLIESGDVIINEDGGTAVVNVRLLNEIENDFELDYNTEEVPDGANEGEDFGGSRGRVVFTPGGVKQRSIEIPITDDQQTETDEPLVVSFSSEDIPADRQDMIPNPMVIIIDNDITVGFDPSAYSVAERPGGFVTLMVTRSGNIDLTASVTLLTLSGSADDMDFTIVSTTVEFGPGEARETVIVPITDDAVPEEAETFTATLMSNTANVVVGVSEATITILENDQPVTGTIVNDTIIGDPLFTVTLPNEDESMCYEVHGYSGKYFNLVSDSCTSVNALFSQLPDNDRINRMSDIGIYARDDNGQCVQVQISVTGCSGSVGGQALSSYQLAGVNVRSYPNRWRVSVPNCGSTQLVMWIFCASEPDMLQFRIARGNNLDPTSHGLLAQFWNIPINITTKNGEPYVQVFDPTHENYRLVPAFPAPLTWDHTPTPCYYVGNAQGGPSGSHDPRESVIEGKVDDYETSSLFSPIFLYGQFDESVCSTAA